MKKLQLSFGFELDEVNPNTERFINTLDLFLTGLFKSNGAKVIDSKFNIEDLTRPTQNKAITGDNFEDYTICPLNVNGAVMPIQIHKDNVLKGNDYPGVEMLQEIVSLNLPLYPRQDKITNIFFYHRCVFVSENRYKKPVFLLQYQNATTRFETLDKIQNYIDQNIY